MTAPPRPRSQAKLYAKLKSFSDGISADPQRYNRTVDEACEIAEAVAAFGRTLDLASNPRTKTRGAVAAKDKARRRAEEVHSRYYNLIKMDPTVSDGDKVGIGVRPVNLERTPVHVPQFVPKLAAILAMPHQHRLRFGDPMNARSGRKPHGAVFIQVYAALGDERNLPVSEAREVGLFTRNPIVVMYTSADNGKQATYYGRWISRKGEAGGWSLPTSMAVVA